MTEDRLHVIADGMTMVHTEVVGEVEAAASTTGIIETTSCLRAL